MHVPIMASYLVKYIVVQEQSVVDFVLKIVLIRKE